MRGPGCLGFWIWGLGLLPGSPNGPLIEPLMVLNSTWVVLEGFMVFGCWALGFEGLEFKGLGFWGLVFGVMGSCRGA